MADKPRTSRCTIVSVGDITDCATSTAYTVLLRFTPEDKVYKCKFVWNQVVGRVKSENLATHPPLSLGPGEFSYGQCFRLKKTNLHFIKLDLTLEYTVRLPVLRENRIIRENYANGGPEGGGGDGFHY